MPTSTLYYHLVIDASQSMRPYWDGIARAGQLHARRLLKRYHDDASKQIHISYNFFNDLFMAASAPVTSEAHCRHAFDSVSPSGGTALYDALGEAIRIMRGMPVTAHDRVLLAVFSDGHENSSGQYTRSQLEGLLMACQQEDRPAIALLGGEACTLDIRHVFRIRGFHHHHFDEAEADAAFRRLEDTLL